MGAGEAEAAVEVSSDCQCTASYRTCRADGLSHTRRFSTRNLTVERPVAERLSLVDGISVQVQASKREELPPTPQELSYTEPALQLPPPVPPKDSPSPHLVQGSPSFSSTARWPAVDVGSRAK